MIKKLLLDKYKVHFTAFILMMTPPAFLYLAAQNNWIEWIWLLLGIIALGNVLALLAK